MVQEIPDSVSGFGKDLFVVVFVVVVVVEFLPFCPIHITCHEMLHFLLPW